MTDYIKEHLNENNNINNIKDVDEEEEEAMNLKPNIESEIEDEEDLNSIEDENNSYRENNDDSISVEFEEEVENEIVMNEEESEGDINFKEEEYLDIDEEDNVNDYSNDKRGMLVTNGNENNDKIIKNDNKKINNENAIDV